jgi:tetratricopeptide (TPR) repeat protein
MAKPDWQKLKLQEDILRETSPDENRIIIWLPEILDGKVRCWKRVSNVAGAAISEEQGMCSTAASSIRAHQRNLGLWDRLIRRFRGQTEAQTWVLPSGKIAEQLGARRTDLLLVWTDEEANSLDEARIKSRWPECQEIQRIGANLFVVKGVLQPRTKSAAEPAAPLPTPESPVQLAERILAEAIRSGDRRREVMALTDLGIVLTRQGNSQRAVGLLEEALALVRRLADKTSESDVLDNLGLATLAAGQPRRALELFQQGVEDARASGNRFAEKMVLMHLGMACSAMRDFHQAFASLDQALDIARQVGDHQHEADLLWQAGIVHAEAGDRDQAVAKAQEAVDLFKQMGNPQADWLESNLEKYRTGQTSAALASVSSAEPVSASIFGGQIVASGWTDQGFYSAQTQGNSGPGLLRMAFSAMKSMARFAGSGFKPTSAETCRTRLQTCERCEHHTGLRCKVCGCFTNVKARMPHESCPIGKWAR